MIIDVKTAKASSDEPEISRERFLLKTGTVFSNLPVVFLVAMGTALAYLRSFLPSQAVSSAEDEYTGPPPEADAPNFVSEEVPPDGEPEEEPAPPKVKSGSSYIDKDEGSFFLAEPPANNFQFSPVAVKQEDGGLFNFRPRAGNDNLNFAGRGEGTGGSSGGDGGGDGPGGTGGGLPDDEEDEDDDETPDSQNRAPRNAATPYLGDIVSGHSFVITFAALLQYATDADADTLRVSNLAASSGTLTAVAGGWLFTPEEGQPGFVTFTYLLKDGNVSVWQTAQARIVLHHEIDGTPDGDVIVGTPHADHVDGLGGDDNLDARDGDDVVNAGEGDDNVVGGAGNDTIYGGAGDDRIFAGAGNDMVWAGAGNDSVFGEDGNDILYGEDGADRLSGGIGADTLFGGEGNDALEAGYGNDRLSGGGGDDELSGDDGNDILDGGAGSDRNRAGAGDDLIIASADAAPDIHDGGVGIDTVVFAAMTSSVVVNLDNGTAGSDETGNDLLAGIENVITGEGDDTIIAAAADTGTNSYDGAAGVDTLDLSANAKGVLVDLTTGRAVGVDLGEDFFENIERVIGTDEADTFVIGANSFSLKGGEGDDEFRFTATDLEPSEHRIEDFDIGDRISLDDLDISRSAVRDVEDLFQDIYGPTPEDTYRTYSGEDGRHVRYRNDRDGDRDRTRVEADLDGDTTYELAINLDGHHVLFIAENIA